MMEFSIFFSALFKLQISLRKTLSLSLLNLKIYCILKNVLIFVRRFYSVAITYFHFSNVMVIKLINIAGAVAASCYWRLSGFSDFHNILEELILHKLTKMYLKKKIKKNNAFLLLHNFFSIIILPLLNTYFQSA